MKRAGLKRLIIIALSISACSQGSSTNQGGFSRDKNIYPRARPDSFWKQKLSAQAYDIMVNSGTETPFSNPYWDNHKTGIYISAATGDTLFSSRAKFDSGTGWPSFWKPVDDKKIRIITDRSLAIERNEIVEASTGLHLGHVFDDGPQPTGKRYCLDSYALKFVETK